ncbi:MAG: cytochrome P450, partial [Actinomycetota bacterium]|nr:cytochrome P450 [Actinomycetota bacterium]
MTGAPATEPDGLAGLDVTKPGFFLRPDYIELLAWLRSNAPLHRLDDGTVLVARYDDIREISRQPELFSSRHGALVNDPVRRNGADDTTGSIIHLDPPIHAEWRRLVNREFTPRAAARFEPAIRTITDEVLDRLSPGDDIDLVAEVASPIPVLVIAELLGIADGDRDDFRRWSDAAITVFDFPTAETMATLTEMTSFLAEHIARRFDAPTDDLISVLATAEVDGRPLTLDQVLMFCMTLLVAGNETTRSLIAGSVEVLAEHPDQRAALAADLALVPAAIEECVRWVTPIQAFCRTAMADTEVGGHPIAEGEYIALLYASGNRDEAAFGATAHRFDVRRPATPAHVAFGFGEHLCLGAALARLEGRIVLEQLLTRFPDWEIIGAPTYAPSTLT